MKPVEVLHLLGSAQPEGTSFARIVHLLALGVDPKRFRLTAWFLGEPGPLNAYLEAVGVPTATFNWQRGVRDPAGAWRFHRALQASRFDIVHQHEGARSVRWLIRRLSGARLLVHLHGSVRNPIVAIANADAAVAPSAWVAAQIPGGRCTVVYPGILPVQASAPTSPVVGMATRLVEGKGVSILLNAMRNLPGTLEIAGEGPLRAALEHETNELGLAARITFLGWQPDLTPILRRWTLLAMPSTDEGFGMAALEAMAHGVPVAGFHSGALPEVVIDGETGLLSRPGDLPAFTRNLAALLSGPELRARMAQASITRAKTAFTPERMTAEMSALYEALVAGHEKNA